VGYIFQESRLFPHLSVKKNLEFGYKNVPEKDRKFNLRQVVAIAGIEQFLIRTPAELSGGERQRVALARSLLASPEYLLLDEPLAALDLPVRLSFLNFLKTVHHKLDLPILYVSHDLSNVLNFADDVIIVDGGHVLGYGPAYQMLEKMTSAPLLTSEAISNIFETEITADNMEQGKTIARDGELELVLPHIDAMPGEKLLLDIPASEIIIAIRKPTGLSASNSIAGTITAIHKLHERILLKVAPASAGRSNQMFTVEVLPATVQRLQLEISKNVYMIIKASSFRRL
jgi:molybdate transport system ATP-binding protein